MAALLDTMVERRSSVNRAEADLLALVVDFADACPPDGGGSGRVDGPVTPAAETAVVELGARLGVSYRAAADLVTEAVQLRDRLPRLWALVQQGRLQAFKARQVARVTVSLSDAAAAFVDAHAAVCGYRNRLPDLRKLVIIAINRCDPDLAEGLEEAAHADRGVTFEYSTSTDTAATARLEATLDVLDALDLDATISHLATEMGRLGDDTPIGVRRAHALGTLANPQRTLDLYGDPTTPTLTDDATTPNEGADDRADDREDDREDDRADDGEDCRVDDRVDDGATQEHDTAGEHDPTAAATGTTDATDPADADDEHKPAEAPEEPESSEAPDQPDAPEAEAAPSGDDAAPTEDGSSATGADQADAAPSPAAPAGGPADSAGPTSDTSTGNGGATGGGSTASSGATSGASDRPAQRAGAAPGVFGTTTASEPGTPGNPQRGLPRRPWDGQRQWNSQIGHVYLHLDAADLRALLADGLQPGGPDSGGAGGVDLERLGAASLRLVREWLGRVTRVSVRPVLDMTTDDPVDQHDPPEAMREQVMLRDGVCVFPGCGVHARACDLDHIVAYLPMDEGGPPGQTHPGNLACLCRRHHRMKTHHGWHYTRARDGTYHWLDPHGVSHTTAPMPLHQRRRPAA